MDKSNIKKLATCQLKKLTAMYMVGLLGCWRLYKDTMYFPSLIVVLLGLRLDAQAAIKFYAVKILTTEKLFCLVNHWVGQ